MIGNTSSNFADLVITGERIDDGIQKGKIVDPVVEASKKPTTGRKKEGDRQAVSHVGHQVACYCKAIARPRSNNQQPLLVAPRLLLSGVQPAGTSSCKQCLPDSSTLPANFSATATISAESSPQPQTPAPRPAVQPADAGANQKGTRNSQERRRIDPIPMSYTELLPKLIENHQVAPVLLPPLQPPYPRWYDPNARCDYHAGAVGHSTENCTALKLKVQALRDAKWLDFAKFTEAPDVNGNPLPNHSSHATNAIDGGITCYRKRSLSEVKFPMRLIFKALVDAEMIQPERMDPNLRYPGYNPNKVCEFQRGVAGHSIEDCVRFRDEVKAMMDAGLIEFCEEEQNDVVNEVNREPPSARQVTTAPPQASPSPFSPKPSAIQSPLAPNPITIQVPSRFPYQNDSAVPWGYDYRVSSRAKKISRRTVKTPLDALSLYYRI